MVCCWLYYPALFKKKLKWLRNSSGEVKTGEKIQGTSGVEGEACLWEFTLQQWGPDRVPPSAIESCRHQCLTSPQASFPPPPQVIFFFTFCKMIHPCPRGYCCGTGVAVFLQNWSYGEAWPFQTDQSRGGRPDLTSVLSETAKTCSELEPSRPSLALQC